MRSFFLYFFFRKAPIFSKRFAKKQIKALRDSHLRAYIQIFASCFLSYTSAYNCLS